MLKCVNATIKNIVALHHYRNVALIGQQSARGERAGLKHQRAGFDSRVATGQ